jgi:LytS/YehU family sensor histidine kinase
MNMNVDYVHWGLYVVLFILLLMSLISFFILSKVLHYHELLRAELKTKLLRKRLDPHFIGNLLQSLTGLFYRGKKEEIGTVIHEYAGLVKSNFESLESDNIALEEEIKFLLRYLYTRNLMSEVQIRYELRISMYTQKQKILIPAMLLQPIVENALDHGLNGNKNPHIILDFHIAQQLRVRVIDNGPGMTGKNLNKENSSLKVTMERLRLLSKLTNKPYTLHFLNDLNEYQIRRGCGIELNLPILQNL